MRSIKSAAYPSNILVFDTETQENNLDDTTIEHELVFGWCAYIRKWGKEEWTKPEWRRFTSAIEFWEIVESFTRSKTRLYIYCHNANFDWQVVRMSTILPARNWVCTKAILADPPNFFAWRREDRSILLLDTTNYWKRSLADIGKRVGLEKLEMPSDWTDPETADRYCKRDVEILLVALRQWIAWLKHHNLGGLSISLAAQALTAFKHSYLDHPIFIDTNVRALELTRASYYGGRCEAWLVGKPVDNVVCVDVNSMYPYVMQRNVFPSKLKLTCRDMTIDELRSTLNDYSVTARVSLDTDEPIYPYRTPDRLIFPVGQFDTILSTPELLHALYSGHITSVSTCAVYESAPIFESFVSDLYRLRQSLDEAGDEAGKYFIKILMNSLYGKFGQKGFIDEIIDTCDPSILRTERVFDIDDNRIYTRRYIAGVVMEPTGQVEARESLPAVAAHVTAYARMYLWSLIEQCGSENVVYMDTDSLHLVNGAHNLLHDFLSDSRLGGLKIEKLISRAIYHGPKDYALDGVRTIKGIRRRAVRVGTQTYYQARWVSLKGSMQAEHVGGPLVQLGRKFLRRVYTKGTVGSEGRVLPIRLTRPE
jgi:hypothetical protein